MNKLKIKNKVDDVDNWNADICPVHLITYHKNVINILKQNNDIKDEIKPDIDRQILLKTLEEVEKEKIYDVNKVKALYVYNSKHILTNLSTNNSVCNEQFIKKINHREILPQEAVRLSPNIMYPERWELFIQKQKESVLKILEKPEATSDIYMCPRCKKRETNYIERQIRSSDEPMTVFITCIPCGYKWKQ